MIGNLKTFNEIALFYLSVGVIILFLVALIIVAIQTYRITKHKNGY